MTVRCLTDAHKNYIKTSYQKKFETQKELAARFYVSERTINRVLIELGLATPVARIKGEAYQIMQLLKKYGITKDKLEILLMDRFSPID